MSVKDGQACPGCGLPNYSGLCPHCRGDRDAYERELVPPFPTTYPARGIADDALVPPKRWNERHPNDVEPIEERNK